MRKFRLLLTALASLVALSVIIVNPALAATPGIEQTQNGEFNLGQQYWQTESYTQSTVFDYKLGKYRPDPYFTFKPNVGWLNSAGACIESSDFNDARIYQYVRVNPYTNYMFYGYAKPTNVTTTDHNNVGANLSVMDLPDPFTQSSGVSGSHSWTYQSVEFNSGDRTIVKLAARLGVFDGRAKGKACFDYLYLQVNP